MLYPVSKKEILALINARNPGSPLKDTDIEFEITAQETDGTTTVKVTPAAGVKYYGQRVITYVKRDLAKSVLGVPVRLLVSNNTTVGALVTLFAQKYGYTFEAAVDFTQEELDKPVDFGESGIQVVEIPAAGTSLVWIGKLSIEVSNDALDLSTIIAVVDLTNFPYLSKNSELASTALITNAGDFSELNTQISALKVGDAVDGTLAQSILAVLVKQSLISGGNDELTTALTGQTLASKTTVNDQFIAQFTEVGTHPVWAGGAVILYGKQAPIETTPPAAESNDFVADGTAKTIPVDFAVNRTDENLSLIGNLTGPSYATLASPNLVFKAIENGKAVYSATINIAAGAQSAGDTLTLVVSSNVNGTVKEIGRSIIGGKAPTQVNVFEFTVVQGQLYINLGAGVKATVNYGNGVTTSTTGAALSYSYPNAPTQNLVITVDPTTLKGTEIPQFGGTAIKSCVKWVNHDIAGVAFGNGTAAQNATALTAVPTDLPAAFRTMNGMFYGCTSFNQDISGWDTSNIVDMTNTFRSASKFNRDISGWNTSKVTTMSGTFTSAAIFNQPIGKWDTSKVTKMDSVLLGAAAFNQDLSGWNTGNVTDMTGALQGTTVFNQDISGWDVSKVTNMTSMFQSAVAFNQDIGKWNTGNVTNMFRMFQGASVFNKNLSGWNVAKVTNHTNFDSNASAWAAGNKPVFPS